MILIIGDAHIKATNLELGRQFLDWQIALVDKHKPEMVVNLGDFFDGHSILRAEILAEYRRFVDSITARGIDYWHVLGNHEMFKPNDASYHALQSMKGLNPKFHVVDYIEEFGDYTFVPYCVKTESFPLQTTSIVFAHQTFTGADFGHGFRPDNGIDADTISADLIISGHIHGRQTVGKVIYPGSPLSNSADDVDQVKGVHLLDPKTFKLTFIESPFPKWRSYTGPGDLHSINSLAQFIDKDPNVKWIFNVAGPRAEITAILDSKEFKALKERTIIRVRAQYTDIEGAKVKIQALSAENAIDQYIDCIYDGAIDKTLLKEQAKKLMKK